MCRLVWLYTGGKCKHFRFQYDKSLTKKNRRKALFPFKINVLGVDTPSTDPAQPQVYPCHMYLQPNNVPLMEYVANLDSIPVRNTTIVLGAMKVRRGTGGPTRVFAFIDEDGDVKTDAVGTISPYVHLIVTMLSSLYLLK